MRRTKLTPEQIRHIASLFKMQTQTLQKWTGAANRTSHIQLLSSAADAIEHCQDYRQLLNADVEGLLSTASLLGLAHTQDMHNISSRTLRQWFSDPAKTTLCLGLLLGRHWELFSELAARVGVSAGTLLAVIKVVGLEPGQLVRFYLVDPDGIVKLVTSVEHA